MIMSTAGGSKIGIKGSLHFRKNSMGEKTQINGRLLGLSPGTHGLSIYSTPSCESVKAHFNPLNKDHGAPCDENHHAGHLGNIVASPDGIARVSIDAKTIQLKGDNSVLGMAIVVHADEDDLGRGGNKESKMTGNSGAAVGCGIIGIKPSFKNHVK
ncbi:OLC1v1004866C2 [Oldenlandia corymbosa var. corymbosa]|nr:OLC1v1004866C2 [Oldenlandia corymbosa var. corymbosa]